MEQDTKKLNRYIIVGPGRSGTTVTHLAVKGHPNVSAVRDEIKIAPLFTQGMATFTISGDKYLSPQEHKNNISAIFDAITTLEANENTIASGLKIATTSPEEAEELVRCLQTYLTDVTIILTVRDDVVAQYGLRLRSATTGQAHSWRSQTGNGQFTVTISPNEFINYAVLALDTVQELRKLKATHKVIEINYERDILANTDKAYSKLFEALGLPQVEISWLNSDKVASPPEEYIINYLELKDILEKLKTDKSWKLPNQSGESKQVSTDESNPSFKKFKNKVKKIMSVIRE